MTIRKIVIYLICFVFIAYGLATLYFWPDAELAEVNYDQADVEVIDFSYSNGLTGADQAEYHHLSQGSEIFPIRLLRALENPDTGAPFMENMERFGLLPSHDRDDGIAVGLTLAKNRHSAGIEVVGITCAACHVAEIRHNGKGVRVDGAPNMFDMQKFYADMFAAVEHAKSSREIRRRVGQRLFAQSYAEYGSFAPLLRPLDLMADMVNVGLNWDSIQARKDLAEVIQKAIKRRDETKDCDDPAVKCTSGPGRLDAFNGTRNFLLARLSEENLVELDAPVKFPPVWGFQDFEWVEWSQNTNSTMERNFTETLGAGATVRLEPGSHDRFATSIPARNMHRLEELAYAITPPVWPEEVLGEIDRDLAAAGEAVYNQRCAACHDYTVADYKANGILPLRRFSQRQIGVDPTATSRVACPVPNVGDLPVAKTRFTAEQSDKLSHCKGVVAGEAFEGYAFSDVVKTAVAKIKAKSYEADGVTAEEQAYYEDVERRGGVYWRDTLLDDGKPFAARPLHGVWAAAPYLHNGSVPTLRDLLTPPDQRIKRFPLGHREYDPVKIGYRTDLPEAEWRYAVDTVNDSGSSNAGHLFGTTLPEAEKAALLEYLKTK